MVFALEESPSPLADGLHRLADVLEGLSLTRFPSRATERDRLVRTIRQYLVPRAADPSTPPTVVFAGPTGSGKSTVVNSVLGLDVSEAGPLRPTTTTPLVLASDENAKRVGAIAGIYCDTVTGDAPILDSMILVDTPDIDSTSTEHRAMAERLIDNADVVVFVISALRYSDAVPWQVLRRAESRGTDVICVLNRVSSANRGAVVDFRSRLGLAGLDDGVITIAEHHLGTGAQRIPSQPIRRLRRHLLDLVDERNGTAEHAFDRVLGATLGQVQDLVRELQALRADLVAYRSRIGVDLRARPLRLDLSAVAVDLLSPVSESASSPDIRQWKRSSHRVDLTALMSRVLARIEGVVQQDLRRWLTTKELEDTWSVVFDPGRMVEVATPALRTAIEGWFDFVRRIARVGGRRPSRLGQAVLVQGATETTDTWSAGVVFGEAADEMVERARRELIGRLGVVYGQFATHLFELLETEVGVPDLAAVRLALGAVKSLPVPVRA